jgi:hypothetical protein
MQSKPRWLFDGAFDMEWSIQRGKNIYKVEMRRKEITLEGCLRECRKEVADLEKKS